MAGIKVVAKIQTDSSRRLLIFAENQHVCLSLNGSALVLKFVFDSKAVRNGRRWVVLFVSRLVTLAFAGSIGMTLVILGCALPQYAVWWTFFVVLFYMLAPIPTLIARRYNEHSGSSSTSAYELAIFITMGFVISSFALPIVLARSPDTPVIKWGACYLTLAGNVVVYATMVGFFMTFDSEDTDYTMW